MVYKTKKEAKFELIHFTEQVAKKMIILKCKNGYCLQFNNKL